MIAHVFGSRVLALKQFFLNLDSSYSKRIQVQEQDLVYPMCATRPLRGVFTGCAGQNNYTTWDGMQTSVSCFENVTYNLQQLLITNCCWWHVARLNFLTLINYPPFPSGNHNICLYPCIGAIVYLHLLVFVNTVYTPVLVPLFTFTFQCL